jgi:hypothetical protein
MRIVEVVRAPISGRPGRPGGANVDRAIEASEKLPGSTELTAATLNTYHDEVASPVTIIDVAVEAVCVNVDHEFADVSRYWTT